MKDLWRRRAVRHVVVGLLPLLVVGPVLIVVLAIRLADTAGPLREATERATGTVQRAGGGADGRELEVSWTDGTGADRTSIVRAATAAGVPVGARVELRYRPGDPGRVFVTGDEASERLTGLTFGIGLVSLVAGGAVIATAVRFARRRSVERRPTTTVPVRYARSSLGLSRRSWLVATEGGRTWWIPVHWDPVLETLGDGTAVAVHGTPSRNPVVVFELAGTPVWQSGRRRPGPPRGEVDREATGDERQNVPLHRHFRADAGVLVAAPALGLLWAFVDDGGWLNWLAATLLAASVLIWVPTMLGSDPR